MNVVALAIPLPALLMCSHLCAAAFSPFARFFLNASADLSPLFAGAPGLHLVLLAHRSGFPFTDAASHQTGAVGFSDIVPLNKEVEHPYVPSVVIDLKLAALESREQTRTDVPAPMKREAVS